MKDRLARLIKDKGLTLSRLADILSIQPSGISHILSGRNNPGYDFICKILVAFPDLSADWLLLGKGGMYSGVLSATETLFNGVNATNQTHAHKYIDAINNTSVTDSAAALIPESRLVMDEAISVPQNALNGDGVELFEADLVVKSVKKVIIFYTDKTCEEYNVV